MKKIIREIKKKKQEMQKIIKETMKKQKIIIGNEENQKRNE